MAFGSASVAVLSPRDENRGWEVVASAGSPVPSEPPDDGSSVPLTGGAVLAMHGRHLTADDRRIVSALGAQTVTALERRRLEDEAATAAALAEADELRTALLRAVSHDLRTPLASIKASVTSLLQRDVEWSPEAEAEFLATIDEESRPPRPPRCQPSRHEPLADRRAGVALRPVALRGGRTVGAGEPERTDGCRRGRRRRIDAAGPGRSRASRAAVANVIANAVNHSPPGSRIRSRRGHR